MARLVNIVRRAGVYHFRRAIPAGLRERLNRRELTRSLDTQHARTAKLRADLLYGMSERLFAAASQMISEAQLARMMRDFYDLSLTINDHQRLFDGAMTAEQHGVGVTYLNAMKDEFRQALARNQLDHFLVSYSLTTVMGRAGLSRDELGPGEENQIRQAILRVGVDLLQELRARYDGDFNYEPKDRLLRPAIAPERVPSTGLEQGTVGTEPILLGETAASPIPSANTTSPSATAPTLSIVSAAFRQEQVLTGVWDGQTENQAGATYRLFVDICGDKPLCCYERADAEQFRKQVSMLPANYSKGVPYRGLRVAQIIERAEAKAATHPIPRLSPSTVKRHFSALSALWSSALPAGSVKENIFSGFRFKAAKRAKEQSPRWTQAELKVLFSAPVWTGCKSDGRRAEPGSLILRDAYYWIPLIGIFSGMRQEEICQLHVEDVREEDSIIYFDLNEQPPRKLKNGTAVRKVPVHRELLRFGFLEYVKACRRSGGALLSPDLTRGGADMRLGHAFSKWFTRYRQGLAIYRPGLDFHALRHTATTLLHQAGVDMLVLDHLTGHTTPGETSRYTKNSSLMQLKDAIDRIEIGIDLGNPNGTDANSRNRFKFPRKAVLRRRNKPSARKSQKGAGHRQIKASPNINYIDGNNVDK